jgi:DNA gyrase subunit A
LIPRDDVLITMSQGGYVKGLPANALRSHNRGTRGNVAMAPGRRRQHQLHAPEPQPRQPDGVRQEWPGLRHQGLPHPQGTLTTKGRHIRNVIDGLDEEISAVLALPEKDPETTVLIVTRNGQVIRTAIEDYDGATRKGGVKGVGLDDGDMLAGAFAVKGSRRLGARVAGEASPGEILASSTVKDLVAGSSLRSESRGVHMLKGIPDPWQLFAVDQNSAP